MNLEASLSAERLAQESVIATLKSELAEAARRARADAELARKGFLSELERVQTLERERELGGRLEFEERRLGALAHGRSAQISAQHAQVDRLRSIAEFRRAQVDDLRMRAGVDGVVQELKLEAGQSVVAGALLVKVVQPDLLYRINTVEIQLPPLRDRRQDILPLAKHFAERLCARHGKPPPTLSTRASRALVEHLWPGNVRELEHVVERALLLARSDSIEPEDLALDRGAATARPISSR